MQAPGPTDDLDTWLRWLETLSPRDIDLGLDRVARVLDRLALPRPRLVISVAGTNGKGSSVAFLHALFRESGESTGAYTSPHIRHYAERIRIDDDSATEADLVAAFGAVESVRGDTPLTYFEFGTLAALWLFARQGLNVWLLEVGLGGRLDAVNAIDPDASLITNVSLDHQEWLGDTLEAIAAEKAGVMRSGVPVVYAEAEPPGAISAAARHVGARLRIAGQGYQWQREADGRWSWHGDHLDIGPLEPPALRGDHQLANAAGVLALLEALGEEKLLNSDLVNRALQRANIPGRQQYLARNGRRWLLDGAHNPAGAKVLADTLRRERRDNRGAGIVLILGVLADKDATGIVAPLAETVDGIITITPPATRALAGDALAALIRSTTKTPVEVAPTTADGLARAIEMTGASDLIVVAGSFYTLQTVLQWLDDAACESPED